MGRVRPGKHTRPPKPPSQPAPPPQPPIDPQVHRLSSSLAAPPSSNLSPHSEADLALFRPSQETVNWLYSLPLPPGVTQQPLPETSEDWALVEKFRWLCQGLVLAGEYERERRRRIERGEDPYSEWEEWDPRHSGNPLVASAVQSLMNSHAPTHPHPSYALSHPLPPHYTHPHPQYAIGNHPQYPSYPADFQPQGYDSLPTHFGGVPIDYGFAGDDEEDEYEDEPYSDRGGEEEEREEEIVSEHTYDFPTLETLQSFAASGAVAPLPLDPSSSSSSLPLSLDLSALTSSLGPNGLGELAAAAGVSVEGLSAAMNGQLGSLAAGVGAGEGEGRQGGEGGTNPASLPSLIAAIAELEQCVARLSLEATEARNLQKSLRDEMSTRTTPSTSTSTSSNAPAGKGKAEAVAATLARAGLRPMKRKVKGGRVVSVSSRSRLPPPAAVKPVAAPSPPVPAAPATNGHPHGHHHHHCSDCGESLSSHSAHASPSPSAPPSRPSSPPPSAPPPPIPQSLPPTAPPSAPLPPPVNANGQQGQGQQQWEDGELMKALQSVSMLDRRADEYRERLRVLKEQIHHHAALADALAAPGAASAASGAAPAAAAPAPVSVEEKKPFGQSVSDTTLELVAVSEYRHRQLSRLQAQSQSSSTSSTSPSSTSPISIDPPAVPSALAPWVPPSGDYNTPMTSEELYTAMRAEREVLLRECSAAESEHGDAELALGAEDLAKQEAFEAYAEQLKKEFEEERTDPMEKSRKAQLVMDVWGRLRPEVQGRWRAEREERERRYYEERERRRKEREKEKVKGEEGKVGEGPEGGK